MAENPEVMAAVAQMSMYLRTLERLRATSTGMHGRVVKAFYELAEIYQGNIVAIRQRHGADPEVARWIAKFDEYGKQHKLDTPKVVNEKK